MTSLIALLIFCLFTDWVLKRAHHEGWERSKHLFAGRPISVRSLENEINRRVWQPIAISKLGEQAIFYDIDGRLYHLDGIRFDHPLTGETFLSSSNGAFITYWKGMNLYFGIYSSDTNTATTVTMSR